MRTANKRWSRYRWSVRELHPSIRQASAVPMSSSSSSVRVPAEGVLVMKRWNSSRKILRMSSSIKTGMFIFTIGKGLGSPSNRLQILYFFRRTQNQNRRVCAFISRDYTFTLQYLIVPYETLQNPITQSASFGI